MATGSFGQPADVDDVLAGSASPAAPVWRPLSAVQRRVVGVLIEKAKTTPDAYPMTLNAITTGANQKNNRHPVTDLDADDVAEALESLREMGAVTELQAAGRVAKFRHNLYQWLGVDKTELAVMAELLLRGEQTVGELRGRAARMEKIADVAELQPILQRLIAKGLVVALSAEGRGQVVTHGLYLEDEQPATTDAESRSTAHVGSDTAHTGPARPARESSPTPSAVDQLQRDVRRLQEEVRGVQEEMSRLAGLVDDLSHRLE
jgi:uncharacterized protein YceH (UPF0502 family)